MEATTEALVYSNGATVRVDYSRPTSTGRSMGVYRSVELALDDPMLPMELDRLVPFS
jgi:hypothetical protein